MSTITRFVNVLAALAGILVLSPVMLVIAIAVLINGGPPVLYRETRLGRHGRPFRIVKFRTMNHANGQGTLVAPAGDPRITRTGRWLRPTHLDELPQLFNILAGDMDFVGPRPARPEIWRGVPRGLRDRTLRFRPGLTSPASLEFICEDRVLAKSADPESIYRKRLFPARLLRDLPYFEQRSGWRDFGIILRTLAVLAGRHDEAACRERVGNLVAGGGEPAAPVVSGRGKSESIKPGTAPRE